MRGMQVPVAGLGAYRVYWEAWGRPAARAGIWVKKAGPTTALVA